MATTTEESAEEGGTARTPFGSLLLGGSEQSPMQLRVRLQTLLTVLLSTTNAIGAGIVFVMATLVVPAPRASDATTLALAIAVPVYVVLAVGAGAVWGTRAGLRSLRWVIDQRRPDEAERRTALRLPWRLTRIQAAFWTAAVVLFTALNLLIQPARALSSGVSIAIAGLMVSATAYLLSEFAFRPIAALALADHSPSATTGFGIRQRMILFWGLGTAAPVVGLLATAVLALGGQDVTVRRLSVTILSLGGVVLVFGLLITYLNSRAVVEPILSVRDALLKVDDGDLDAQVAVYDGTELGMLQSGFNQTVAGLRERERLRDLFGRHVGRDVAAQAAQLADVELGGEARTVSVLFVDLVGSTGFAAERDPGEVVEMLNRFFGVVVQEVDRHEGLVNKFIGDAVLAVFGAPVELDDHASAALAAARAMARRLREEVTEIGCGIGVATGEAVAGNVGDESRFEYTVIGDAVNSASRLTDLAKDVPGGVLAARVSVDAATQDEASHWSDHEPVTLRGRNEPTETSVLADPEED
ncbi:adenylate cyclase [Marmoricola endophyticus]|uniref:Adenylate cyclase n=1 Tax=Marmoricola endophyticus TaxID=2040280 RepID=A0A917BIF8_9ACTN|nr:adenylate/guanylate cyclase domain-containing protein [Marmoricola endophyticus]GGF44029.1 adenylate cyclase [Marmoricola endophyticus]